MNSIFFKKKHTYFARIWILLLEFYLHTFPKYRVVDTVFLIGVLTRAGFGNVIVWLSTTLGEKANVSKRYRDHNKP